MALPALSFSLHVVKVEEVTAPDGAKSYQATLTPVVGGTGLTLINPPTPIVLASSDPVDVANLDCGYEYPVSLGEPVKS